MKAQICALSALAVIGLAPQAAAAADLGAYGPVVAYYGPRYYRPYPYWAGYYPYRWGPRGWYGRRYGYGYGWGRGGWGHGGWGHHGWR